MRLTPHLIEHAPATCGWCLPLGAHSRHVELVPAMWSTPLPSAAQSPPCGAHPCPPMELIPLPLEHACHVEVIPATWSLSPPRGAHPPPCGAHFPPHGARARPVGSLPTPWGLPPPCGAHSHHVEYTLSTCGSFPPSWGTPPPPGSSLPYPMAHPPATWGSSPTPWSTPRPCGASLCHMEHTTAPWTHSPPRGPRPCTGGPVPATGISPTDGHLSASMRQQEVTPWEPWNQTRNEPSAVFDPVPLRAADVLPLPTH